MFEKEIKVSEFADDTNLFCANLSFVEKGLRIVVDFGAISGLKFKVVSICQAAGQVVENTLCPAVKFFVTFQ